MFDFYTCLICLYVHSHKKNSQANGIMSGKAEEALLLPCFQDVTTGVGNCVPQQRPSGVVLPQHMPPSVVPTEDGDPPSRR